jgi:hypothetical protein
MITFADRTSVAREIDRLIDQQIHDLNQDAEISECQLTDHTERSRRIRSLCRSLRPGSPPNWISSPSAGDVLIK